MIAEDVAVNRKLVSLHLTKAGAEVDLAENGCIAVDKVRASLSAGRPYDLVFMDIQMPELDVFEATAKLREMGYRRPIIALTAHAMEGDRERILEAGFDDYLTKPIHRAKLLEAAARHLGVESPSR